jgi:hypothetical protein
MCIHNRHKQRHNRQTHIVHINIHTRTRTHIHILDMCVCVCVCVCLHKYKPAQDSFTEHQKKRNLEGPKQNSRILVLVHEALSY